jgi:hypothetical protein
MADKDKKNKIETEGYLTSIITSDDTEMKKDSLSLEIKGIREEIMTLEQGDTGKLEKLLGRFDSVLRENCERIRRDYEDQGCPGVEVEPAIGYFIPDVDKQDALLKGVEPSVIVTAKDLSEDGLGKFLLASGVIGESYSQDAEILKFPIADSRFDDYVKQKSEPTAETALIGTVTDDNIIPTFEVIVNIPELIGELRAMDLSEDYLKNTELYANIILQLANQQYGASTWPTQRQGFSTIYIKGWDGAERSFGDWYRGLSDYLDSFAKGDSREIEEGVRLGEKASISEPRRSSLQGYRTVNELLIIPQKKPGILSGDDLLYTDLKSDKKRRKLVNRLLDIL